jgi:tyrosyl-tRNA synthetase
MIMDRKLEYVLKRGVAEIIIETELVQLLESGKRLRLKMGFDPSRPDIHLGHVVGIRKLRQFQELGHQVVLIVGDWTAQIGDPSGTSQTRPMLSAEEVRANAETYMEQFFKVVDKERTELLWQSEWFGKFSLADVISLTSKFTVAQMLARDDFSKRYASGRPIAITELLYPLLQAYDSVMMRADVEFGGTDQKFNCLMGRELQRMVGQTPQHVFLMPLLVGTDGQQKMSKSLDNYVAIEDPPNDMYGKLMSIPDDLMMAYFELLTDVPDAELAEFRQQMSTGSANHMTLKKRLAAEIVSEFHGAGAAGAAESAFERVVQAKEAPEEIPECRVSLVELAAGPSAGTTNMGRSDSVTVQASDLLLRTGMAESRGEAKRLITQGAVEVDGRRMSGTTADVRDGSVLKVGKRRWVRIVDADAQA